MSQYPLNPSKRFQSIDTSDLKAILLNTNQINSHQSVTVIENLLNKETGKSLSYQAVLLDPLTGRLGNQQTVLLSNGSPDPAFSQAITSTLGGTQFSVQSNIDNAQFGDNQFLYKTNGIAELGDVLKVPITDSTYLGTQTVGDGYTYTQVEGVTKFEYRFDQNISYQDLDVKGNIIANTLTSNGFSFVNNNLDIDGDLNVTGNFNVTGTFTTINTTDLIIEDNIILLNNGESGAGVSEGQAGFQIDRGSLPDYMLVYDESIGIKGYVMGEIGNEKPLLVRESIVVPNGIPFWDADNISFNTNSNGLIYDQLKSEIVSGSNLHIDYINEKTTGTGTEINGVLIQGSNVFATNFVGDTLVVNDFYTVNVIAENVTASNDIVIQNNLEVDLIKSYLPNVGVTIESINIISQNVYMGDLFCSNVNSSDTIYVDKISEFTVNTGIMIDSILVKGDNIVGGNLEMEYGYFTNKLEVFDEITANNYVGNNVNTVNAEISDVLFTNNIVSYDQINVDIYSVKLESGNVARIETIHNGTLNTDAIYSNSILNGVTIEDTLVKNGNIYASNVILSDTLYTNNISYNKLSPNPINTYTRTVVTDLDTPFAVPIDVEYIGVYTDISSIVLDLPSISVCGLKHIRIQDENFNCETFNIIINANSAEGDTFKNVIDTSNIMFVNGSMTVLYNDGDSKWFQHTF
jgi:hypothetical protein